MLTVTNRNNFDFDGRFNGIDYPIPAGATVAVPEDAAQHIFGLGQSDKTDVLVRQGWMQNSAGYLEGMAILNKFSFNVANQLVAGEIVSAATVDTEQCPAPLQTEAVVEATVSDGAEATTADSASAGGGGSILDVLGGAQ